MFAQNIFQNPPDILQGVNRAVKLLTVVFETMEHVLHNLLSERPNRPWRKNFKISRFEFGTPAEMISLGFQTFVYALPSNIFF